MVGTRSKRGFVEHETEKQYTKSKYSKASADRTAEKEDDDDDLALKVFLNPLIMNKIIQHLPLRSLPTLRSTCKLWNNLMVEEYRERKSINNPYLVKINKDSLDTVFETLNEAIEVPFSAYKFEDIDMTLPKVQKLIDKVGGVMSHLELGLNKLSIPIETFRTLLFKQCPVLRSLVISDHTSCVVHRFWSYKLQSPGNEGKEEVQTLPQLKTINLRPSFEIRPDIRHHASSCFGLLNDLFRAANNLETIKIDDFAPSNILLNGVVLDALLRQQPQSGNLHKIKNIIFVVGVKIKNLEDLVELSSRKCAAVDRLGLKELNLRLFLTDACFMDPQGVRLMKQFLNLQAASLGKLTAALHTWDANGPKNYNVTLPIMPSLKTLELQIEYSTPTPPVPANANANNAANNNNGLMLPNIRFDSLNTNFPNLRKLMLMQMDWMEFDFDAEDAEERIKDKQHMKTAFMAQLGSHDGIIDLNVTLDAEDSSYLIHYGSLFPNVKNLTVSCWSQLYPEVWSVWSALELLTIHIAFETEEGELDSGITGIPIQDLKSTSHSKNVKAKAKGQHGRNVTKEKKEEKKVELGLDWKKYKTKPGISDLHELREFNLDCYVADDCKESYLTELSATYGFIPTANNFKLRNICIRDCSNFSPEVMAAVEASLGPQGVFSQSMQEK